MSPERLIKERMRGLEIGPCYCSDNFEEVGEGIVIVSRKHKGDTISFCAFLVDTYCLGLRRAFWEVRTTELAFNNLQMIHMGELRRCEYNLAHNWIYGAIAWAEDAGLAPCKEWNLAQYFLEEDTDDIPLIELPFGMEGKHLLVVNNQAELNRYLPILRKNLGDDFDYMFQDDEGDYDEDSAGEDDNDYDPFIELDKDYSYVHPTFPSVLNLHHPELYDATLARDPMWYISIDQAKHLLELPHDELREDLEQLILYTLGRLYNGQTTEKEDAIIENAAILLGEVGNDTTSLAALLEPLKLSNRLFEDAFGDLLEKTIIPSICKLGSSKLDKLYDFMLEQGFDSMHKCFVSEAVSEMMLQQPDRRAEIVGWYAKLLIQEMKEDEAASVGIVGMGYVVCNLIDIQAEELLAEIEQAFDRDLVDIDVCGSFQSVKQDILHPRYPRKPDNLDIIDRIVALNKFVKNNLKER